MGQTLTHGIYLPDEGERNCYNGLAANWQLLDNSVGTIAEHSTQIAEKAPLVHTHTKSDITDFPVYGTTAGTICEGNDSRLSDARTPVAHTHTKSDVTDLFNSVNTWTANNRIQAFLEMQYLASGGYTDIRWYDENNVNCCTFRQSANYLTIGKKYTGKSSWYDGAQILITAGGTVVFKGYDGANTQSAAFTYDSFYPEQNNAINLGTSTNKWKTLNGINPGALSLPTIASTNIDTTNWNLRGGYICNITHTVNCYICVQIQRPVDFGIWAIGVGRQTFRAVLDSTGNYLVMVWFPCIVGIGVQLFSVPLIDTPAEAREPDLNIQVAKYFPCQGNV